MDVMKHIKKLASDIAREVKTYPDIPIKEAVKGILDKNPEDKFILKQANYRQQLAQETNKQIFRVKYYQDNSVRNVSFNPITGSDLNINKQASAKDLFSEHKIASLKDAINTPAPVKGEPMELKPSLVTLLEKQASNIKAKRDQQRVQHIREVEMQQKIAADRRSAIHLKKIEYQEKLASFEEAVIEVAHYVPKGELNNLINSLESIDDREKDILITKTASVMPAYVRTGKQGAAKELIEAGKELEETANELTKIALGTGTIEHAEEMFNYLKNGLLKFKGSKLSKDGKKVIVSLEDTAGKKFKHEMEATPENLGALHKHTHPFKMPKIPWAKAGVGAGTLGLGYAGYRRAKQGIMGIGKGHSLGGGGEPTL